MVCGTGWAKIDGSCVKVCMPEDVGNDVCNPECDTEQNGYDGYDCVVCGTGYHRVGPLCQSDCECEAPVAPETTIQPTPIEAVPVLAPIEVAP